METENEPDIEDDLTPEPPGEGEGTDGGPGDEPDSSGTAPPAPVVKTKGRKQKLTGEPIPDDEPPTPVATLVAGARDVKDAVDDALAAKEHADQHAKLGALVTPPEKRRRGALARAVFGDN